MTYIDSSTASPLSAMGNGSVPEPVDIETAPLDEPIEDGVSEAAEEAAPAGSILAKLIEQIDDVNLARYIDDQELNTIGMAVVREYDIDERSRSEWARSAEQAMKFTLQHTEAKTFPWANASSVIFPLITQASMEFGARTYPAVIQGRDVVKGVVWGSDVGTPVMENGQPIIGPNGQPQWLVAPGEKRSRADRIAEHMSYQFLDKMPEWEPQTDQMLHQLPVIGGSARKTYRDHGEKRNLSLVVSLMNLVWDYNAPSFEAAPRHSEKVWLYPHQIVEMERAGKETEDEEGMFLHLDYGPAGGDEGEDVEFTRDHPNQMEDDPSAPHLFIEQHRRWDLDGDGYPEPVIITVHKRSAKVVRVVARYDEEGIRATEDGDTILRVDPVEHYTLYPFLPNIEGGSYPMGFGHLLRHMNEALNTTLNQMFDAGTLQNTGGGFIGDGMSIGSGDVKFSVGKWHRVTTRGQSIRENVFPIPWPGPSPVLFQLFGVLLSSAKEVAGIQNILTGDAAIANAPPTTVLALIEQGLKVYTAIIKRVFRAMKQEYSKMYRLNRLYMDGPESYRVGDEEKEITPDDYRLGGGVEPIADPSQVTDMQKLIRAQILLGFKGDPLVKQDELYRRVFAATQIERIDDLMAPPDPMGAVAAQMMMALKQAELGRERAAEQKDATQAFLNLANARKVASGPEMDFIDKQMEFLRLQVEGLNTAVKAAAVDHKFHDTNMRIAGAHAQALASQPGPVPPAAIQPTPPPTGPFPTGPGPSPQSAGPVAPLGPQGGSSGTLPPLPPMPSPVSEGGM